MRISSPSRLLPLAALVALGSFAACSSSKTETSAPLVVSDSANPASVVINMYAGSNGALSGTCSGTLIAPRVVATAGHCVAGKKRWKVTAPFAKSQVAAGIRARTHDWKEFRSSKSQPTRTDVALIELDTPIVLDKYPTLATAPATDGTALVRTRRAVDGAGLSKTAFQDVSVVAQSGRTMGFPTYYAARSEKNELVDTGGGLIDPKTNTLYGVVSSRGMKTGRMYVARIDSQVAGGWVTTQVRHQTKSAPGEQAPPSHCYGDCNGPGGGTTTPPVSTSDGGILCDTSVICLPDGSTGGSTGGNTSAGSTGGGSTGSSTGGSTGTTTGGSTGSSTGSTGGATSGGSSGATTGTTTGSTGGATSGGSTGDSTGGSTGSTSGGSSGATSGGSAGGTSGGGSGATTGSSSGGSSGATAGTTGGSGGGSGGSTGTSDGTSGGSGGGSGGSTGGDCDGPECGGCEETTSECEDETVDYGDCDCSGPRPTGTIY